MISIKRRAIGKGAFLAILLSFVSISGGYEVSINKCCGEYEMLSGDGRSCVEAQWPRNASLHYSNFSATEVQTPLDGDWVRHWLPPGISLESIEWVSLKRLDHYTRVQRVDSSSIWDGKPLPFDDNWKRRFVAKPWSSLVRPKPGGGVREAEYCVDAALPPLAPFAMAFQPTCMDPYCVRKCCRDSKLLVKQEGNWKCKGSHNVSLKYQISALLRIIDPETGVSVSNYPQEICRFGRSGTLRLAANDERLAILIQSVPHDFFFSSWETCADYEELANKSLADTFLYCEYSRITRGVYWLLRPLSIASSLLLAAALLAIASNGRMRRTAHGWSLASHAACLLAFNVGQTAYSLTIGDQLLKLRSVPYDQETTCKNLALLMYFLLVGAAAWLTAVCINMLMGFGQEKKWF